MIEHRLKCSLNILPRLYFIKPGDIENIIIDEAHERTYVVLAGRVLTDGELCTASSVWNF